MANSATTQEAPPKVALTKSKPLTRAQAEKAMKENKQSYLDYQVDRGKGVKRDKNKHAVGYQAYKSAYRRLLDIKREAGEIKAKGTAPAAAAEPAVTDVDALLLGDAADGTDGTPVEGAEGATPDEAA